MLNSGYARALQNLLSSCDVCWMKKKRRYFGNIELWYCNCCWLMECGHHNLCTHSPVWIFVHSSASYIIDSIFTTCTAQCSKGGIVFTGVCLWLCLSVNVITPELLEITSWNCQIILGSKGRPSSKMAINRCAADELTTLMFHSVTVSAPWWMIMKELMNTVMASGAQVVRKCLWCSVVVFCNVVAVDVICVKRAVVEYSNTRIVFISS